MGKQIRMKIQTTIYEEVDSFSLPEKKQLFSTKTSTKNVLLLDNKNKKKNIYPLFGHQY